MKTSKIIRVTKLDTYRANVDCGHVLEFTILPGYDLPTELECHKCEMEKYSSRQLNLTTEDIYLGGLD